ncbi:hypothetical protein, partial [Corynebacterium nasicanis]
MIRRLATALTATALLFGLALPASADPAAGPERAQIAAQSEFERAPTVIAVDRATGRPVSDAAYNVQVNNLITGEQGTPSGPYSVSVDGAWIAHDVAFSFPDGLRDGVPVDQLVLTEVNPPDGYLPVAEPITLTATVNGWQATGPVLEVAPNVFVIEYDRDDAGQGVPGTEDNPIVLEQRHYPTFVAVDATTGQTLSGSYWGGESCTRFNNDPDWTCTSLDDYRLHMDRDGRMLTSKIDMEFDAPHNFELINRMAPPGCRLKDESVWWKADAEGAKVYGGGVYQLGETRERVDADGNVFRQTLMAIPFDCENPTPVCTAADRPVHEVAAGSRYDQGERGTLGAGPSVVRTDTSGRIVSDSLWSIDVYWQPAAGAPWEQIAAEQAIELPDDGSAYTRDVSVRQEGRFVSVFRELRAAQGTTLRERTYVFEGDSATGWTGTEGATVAFDAATGEIQVIRPEQPPAQPTLYRVNGGDWAIGEPLGGPACQPTPPPGGSSLWPLLLVPPALNASSNPGPATPET